MPKDQLNLCLLYSAVQLGPERLEPLSRRDEQKCRRLVLLQSFEIGYRLLIGKPSPELRFDQYALFVVLIETREIRPRPFLAASLRFHLGDFPNLRAAGSQHVLKRAYSRRGH